MVFWNEIKPDEEGGGAQVEKGAPSTLPGDVYYPG